jgi:GNAT superfamily N-acetyltransferase
MTVRRARPEDVPAIVAMLADDELGARRETPDDLAPYHAAFEAVDTDPNQHLVVLEREGRVVGCLQLTVIPGLSRRGATRAIIEAVRVAASERGEGLGAAMIGWAIDESRRLGVNLLQLTSDRTRTDAHRFYGRLGFEATHLGFKMQL